jgi:hypothetical protein
VCCPARRRCQVSATKWECCGTGLSCEAPPNSKFQKCIPT